MRSIIFSIATLSHLKLARALSASLHEHQPGWEHHLLIPDLKGSPPEGIPARIWGLQAPWKELARRYPPFELCGALRPFVFQWLLERTRAQRILYLDCDMLAYSPLAEVAKGLDRHNLLLTPHLDSPYPDREKPWEPHILAAGIYNSGVVALRRSAESLRFLKWWQDMLERDCVVDVASGRFVDQKWLDLAPLFFKNTGLLRHPGYNTAFWNLHSRPLSLKKGLWHCAGKRLALFHFSGYDPAQPWILSRHQDRFDLRKERTLKALTDAYAEKLA